MNLITYSISAAVNYYSLIDVYTQYRKWAQAHSAKFTPDKYQLIHFIHRRRYTAEDFAFTVEIEDH